MNFAHPPLAALAAIAFPVVVLAQRLAMRLHDRHAFAYSNLPYLTRALNAPEWPVVALDLVFAASFTLVLAAAAGPRFLFAANASPAIAICLDTSGSMRAQDIRPSRAAAAAGAIRAFVNEAPARARIGLVSFAGVAQRVVTPGKDRRAMLQGLTRVPAPNGQTAIGDGLSTAAAMLPESGARTILLVTDGANNRGEEPRAVVKELARSHIRLDVIAIGNAYTERQLRSFAAQTGGVFARAGNAGNLNAQMLQFASKEFVVRAHHDATVEFVIAALLLGAAAWLAAAGAGRR